MKRALVAIVLTACGGAAAPAQVPGGAAAPESTSTPPEAAGAHANTAAPSIASARAEIDRDEQRIAAAQSDCAEACRALSSMERAAEHLCALDGGAECSRVRERVEAARERVRASCGECAR